ncbi:hypothetical protein FBZ93_110172 [Bradyrhizobium macuxiense]|uniref:Uncharacterized protein n=1 Tax=Bradyrhizobium macuxiense TaxID=1755647 RepID=A0A560LE01_9BRAD|nr:hypothetical protein [Bradyrhizobium macuxiense]TWB93567.1 hypothetical protein FBZ93_110172 [Bradyrhizobium macuxiense]
MTDEVVGERFSYKASGIRLSDFTVVDCEFSGCVARRTEGSFNLFERIDLERASQMNCSVFEAVFRDLSLRGLKRLGDAPLFLWGCVFERVALSGRISAVKINDFASRITESAEENQRRRDAHDLFVRNFYSKSDWALDIAQAEFPGGISFEQVPGDKIRRDPDRQVLVTRSALAVSDWRALDFDRTAIDIALGWFERYSIFDSVVLAARSDRKWSKRDLAVLARLRDAGIANLA